jgi:hypothetical protein
MMVIGANTPAMIKAMTAEVESKNFIVASIHPDVENSWARLLPPQPCGPPSVPAFVRARSLSHYTLDAITGNGRYRGLVPTTRKKKASPTKFTGMPFPSSKQASPTSRGILYNCHKL